jgi:hypothetical protein
VLQTRPSFRLSMDRTLGLHRRIDRVGADQDGVFPLVVDAG